MIDNLLKWTCIEAWIAIGAAVLFLALSVLEGRTDKQALRDNKLGLSETVVAQCWRSAQLKASPGEAVVRKGVPEAYQPPPKVTPVARAPLPRNRHKTLRGVNLPLSGRKLIALTFDLCEQPHEIAGYEGTIVDFLRENKVRATFFAGGKWMLSHRERAQQLLLQPLFEVANHSWEHRNLRFLRGQALKDEIVNADYAYADVRAELMRRCTSLNDYKISPAPVPKQMSLFRFPFGACDAEALRAVGEAGLIAVQWDVSSGDPSPEIERNQLIQGIMEHVKPGSIVLFHANGRGWSTPAALPDIVRQLRSEGYEFATVSDLLNEPGAEPVFSDTCFDTELGDTNRYDDLSRRLEATYELFTEAYEGNQLDEAAKRWALSLSMRNPIPGVPPRRFAQPPAPPRPARKPE